MNELQSGLPPGVELVVTYDRSGVINRAVRTLSDKLLEESLVVALVCLAFLFHLRSSLVAVVTLPVGILAAFIVMENQGVTANIMSLGGIAIAIGAMVDAAVVMIENMHKHLERGRRNIPITGTLPTESVTRSRAGAVFFAAGHHGIVPAGVHAHRAGRQTVRAAGLHQDLCHGRRRDARRDAGAGADGLFHPRANPAANKAIRSTGCCTRFTGRC